MATPAGDSYSCNPGGVIAAGRHHLPAWLRAAPIGQWSPVTGSALGSSSALYSWPDGSAGSVSGVVNGWGGWAIDYVNKKIYLQGGGHADYGGNEIYCLDLVTMVWSRIVDPTSMALATRFIDSSVHSKWNADGTPVSGHMYWATHFINGTIFRGPYFADFGQTRSGRHAFAPNNEGRLHGFNVATGQWDSPTARANIPNFTAADLSSGSIGYYAVSDGTYYYAVLAGAADGMTKLRRYDPVADTWVAIGDDLGPYVLAFDGYPGIIHDSSRNEMVWIGENTNSFVRRINLATGVKTDSAKTGIAYASAWDSSYTGCCYDSKRDKYYLYSGQAGKDKNVYVCDPASGYAISVMADSGTPTPTTVVAGMCSRFKYISGWDCLLMQPTFDDPIQVLRLS